LAATLYVESYVLADALPLATVTELKEDRWSKAKTVEEYLAAVPPRERAALEELRRTIRSAAPDAEEGISYRMPVFKLNGALVFYAAFSDHLSLFVASKEIVKEFAKDLKPYYSSGATIHFTPEKPLPASLVKRLVKAKIEQNEERAKKRLSRQS
jgi:uncharacterized protein YdhG (YjbR/CyaY superfamily)